MKDKELHNFIQAFDGEVPATPLHRQALKRALMSAPRQQSSFASRIQGAFANLKGASMKRTFTIAGTTSLAVALIAASGAAIYTFKYSPHALAEGLVNNGLVQVDGMSTLNITELQTQLGIDPKQALLEAQKASDLKQITKVEFDAETAKMSNSTSTATAADGSTVGMVKASASLAPGSAPIPDSSGAISVSSSAMSISANGQGIPITDSTMIATPQSIESNVSTFLKFTDDQGSTVLLGLNDQGVPVLDTTTLPR